MNDWIKYVYPNFEQAWDIYKDLSNHFGENNVGIWNHFIRIEFKDNIFDVRLTKSYEGVDAWVFKNSSCDPDKIIGASKEKIINLIEL